MLNHTLIAIEFVETPNYGFTHLCFGHRKLTQQHNLAHERISKNIAIEIKRYPVSATS